MSDSPKQYRPLDAVVDAAHRSQLRNHLSAFHTPQLEIIAEAMASFRTIHAGKMDRETCEKIAISDEIAGACYRILDERSLQ